MRLLLRWLFSALALMLVAYLIPGIVVENFGAALIAALVLGLVNALIRPILLILTLPITIITLGLFTLIINAFMFWLVATIIDGFAVAGFWPAFWGAVVMWMVGWVVNGILKR